MRKQVKADIIEKKEIQATLNLEGITKIWEEHKENHGSAIVKNAMNNALLGLEDKCIMIWTPNAASKNILLQEPILMDKMRDEFSTPDLQLQIEIDKDKFPDFEEVLTQSKRTNAEIYQDMAEKNKVFAAFVEKLNLKPV